MNTSKDSGRIASSWERWVPGVCRLAAVGLGVLHTAAAVRRFSMNADGISYLDIGDLYMRGDWAAAVNSVWSPMYSWILGSVLYIFEPSARWEFAAVQLANLAIYLVALLSFEFFWRQLMTHRRSRLGDSRESRSGLPDWAWPVIGYGLFIYTSLGLIELWSVTPDMLMTVWVYLASGLILRIRSGTDSWAAFVGVGLLMGASYLTKSVMLPLSLAFILAAFLSAGRQRRLVRTAVALGAMLVVAAPFIAAISSSTGRFTTGDAGRLTFLRHVNGISYPHWQGSVDGFGQPEHGSRLVHNSPPVYEFAEPIAGTYPISFDPSYWYRGAIVQLQPARQLIAVAASGLFYAGLFFMDLGAITFGIALLSIVGAGKIDEWWEGILNRTLLLPALAAFALYALVLVEGRYIAVFVVLFFGDLLANLVVKDSHRRLAGVVAALMAVFLVVRIGIFNLDGVVALAAPHSAEQTSSNRPDWPGEPAEVLQELGVVAGDHVGVIGYAFDSYWARLGRMKIVAEMPGTVADIFWYGDESSRTEALGAFRRTGVRAIVAESVPYRANTTGWRRVGESDYYIYLFR
ncbi:MAG: hypothetical protein HKN37_01330 [Rhodothermales bacterium]|nr:hypothetical protein [Rhodothermales bacterium]